MTMLFVSIIVLQIANVFNCRSDRYSVFNLGFFSNRLIFGGIAFELLFAALIIYVPFFQKVFQTAAIGWYEWGIWLVFASLIFLAEELRKKLCR